MGSERPLGWLTLIECLGVSLLDLTKLNYSVAYTPIKAEEVKESKATSGQKSFGLKLGE